MSFDKRSHLTRNKWYRVITSLNWIFLDLSRDICHSIRLIKKSNGLRASLVDLLPIFFRFFLVFFLFLMSVESSHMIIGAHFYSSLFFCLSCNRSYVQAHKCSNTFYVNVMKCLDEQMSRTHVCSNIRDNQVY